MPADPDEVLVDMSNTLKQVLEVLRGPTIAKQLGEDVQPKFWAMYEKVSNEYDNDFLKGASDDMSNILTFAGLFSAVNSTFIIGLQHNPVDTTNDLMVQLIQTISNDSNAVNHISNIRTSTTQHSSTVWMQTLAYASLALSLLAAFGAVMGKQWLNSYKAARKQGSLEQRSLERQKKLDGIEYWHLRIVLRTFFVLLQISLFLFGISLSANIWNQQKAISIVVISTTAFGIICYLATIFVSVLSSSSPFRTLESQLVGLICKKLHLVKSTLTDKYATSRAVRWILKISTNPECVASAAAMVPLVPWLPKVDVSSAYKRLFKAYRGDRAYRGDGELYTKAMAHLLSHLVKPDPPTLQLCLIRDVRNLLVHNALTAGYDAWYLITVHKQRHADKEDLWEPKDQIRIALRTMVVYGQFPHLSFPDDENLIWKGDLRWWNPDNSTPCGEFDWLVDYLGEVDDADDEGYVSRDALLALSAMHALGSRNKRDSYIDVLIRCMQAEPSRVRHAALRATADAREELASWATDDNTGLLDRLSCAILTAVSGNRIQTVNDGGPDCFSSSTLISCPDLGSMRIPTWLCPRRNIFHADRDLRYLLLIFRLAANEEWRRRLRDHDHVTWCITLSNHIPAHLSSFNFYLVRTILRIDPSYMGGSSGLSQKTWPTLMIKAWSGLNNIDNLEDDCIDVLPKFVEATTQILPDSNGLSKREPYASLTKEVKKVLGHLKNCQGVDDEKSKVDGLYEKLRR